MAYASKGGELHKYGPVLANSFKRPAIAQYKPEFAYKQPQIAFKGGEGHTHGPVNHYHQPQIKQVYKAPHTHLHAPKTAVATHGPGPHFAVQGPAQNNHVHGPHSHSHHHTRHAAIHPGHRHMHAPAVKTPQVGVYKGYNYNNNW